VLGRSSKEKKQAGGMGDSNERKETAGGDGYVSVGKTSLGKVGVARGHVIIDFKTRKKDRGARWYGKPLRARPGATRPAGPENGSKFYARSVRSGPLKKKK